MVENYNEEKETRKTFMAEMVATRGWELFEEGLLAKRDASVRALTSGSPSSIDMNDVILNRSRIRLIDEMLNSVKP